MGCLMEFFRVLYTFSKSSNFPTDRQSLSRAFYSRRARCGPAGIGKQVATLVFIEGLALLLVVNSDG
jgi:hypothetical protein